MKKYRIRWTMCPIVDWRITVDDFPAPSQIVGLEKFQGYNMESLELSANTEHVVKAKSCQARTKKYPNSLASLIHVSSPL